MTFPLAYPRPLTFAILVVCACLLSAWKVTLPLPLSSGATLSVSYAADLMALMLLDPAQAMLVAMAGAWTQCTFKVKRPYPWYRTAFSVCAEALTMQATSATYGALGGAVPLLSLATLPKALVGTIVTYFVVNSGLMALAIGLSTRRSPWRIWRDDFLWSGPSFIVAGSAGAIGAVIVERGDQWLAILMVAPVYLTYRTYHVFLGRVEDARAHLAETQKLHSEAVEALMLAKRAEQALADEKERLAVTLRSIGDGVIATDLEGRILLINKVAEGLTGCTQAEALGKPLPDIFRTFEADTMAPCDTSIEALSRMIDPAGMCRSTMLVAKDLREHPIEEIVAPLRDAAARTIGIVVAFRDITQALKMREERARADRVASLGLLAGGIAHDFNNILMTIMGNISMARAIAPARSTATASLAEAEQACLRARQLTWQLLTFSKGGVPTKKPIDLAAMLQDSTRDVVRATRVTCRVDVAADLLPVLADEQQLVQVFNNVLTNAHEAMPHGGWIDVRAENVVEPRERWEYALRVARGGYVRVSFTDHGIGIPPEHIGRIFDPYFTTKQTGSGLGLATSYSIVKNHGGYVSVRSAPGEGTTVSVHLPASPQMDRSNAVGRAPQRFDGRGRILVLEDEPSVQTLAVNMLALLGHETEVVEDGTLAVEHYRRALQNGRPFDAVMLDLVVPGGMGGAETIGRLTEIDPAVNAILVSGFAQHPTLTGFKDYGFKAVISKPFTLQELRSIIDSVMVTPATWTIH
jgi:PAS domain S-box-containing protein